MCCTCVVLILSESDSDALFNASPRLLRRNYDTLLAMFQREKEEKERLQQRLADLDGELTEAHTLRDVDMDNLRMETLDLRSRLRQAQTESSHAELFARYEEELRTMSASLSRIRHENTNLMAMMDEALDDHVRLFFLPSI